MQTDSIAARASKRNTDSISYTRSLIVKDTIINIPARSVKDTLSSSDLAPAYTVQGHAVKRSYFAATSGARAFLNVLPDGRVEYGCNADSLSIVVQSLIRENTELRRRNDSVQFLSETVNKKAVMDAHSNVVRTRSFLAVSWPWILLLAVVAVALYLAKRGLKWPL